MFRKIPEEISDSLVKLARRKMETKKSQLITKISIKQIYVRFFPTNSLMNKRECNEDWQ